MFGNNLFTPGGTRRIQLADARREMLDVFLVKFSAVHRFPFLAPGAQIRISQAFQFGAPEGGFFHQQTLALVSFAGAAPFQHHCRQNGVSRRAASKGGITGCDEYFHVHFES